MPPQALICGPACVESTQTRLLQAHGKLLVDYGTRESKGVKTIGFESPLFEPFQLRTIQDRVVTKQSNRNEIIVLRTSFGRLA